jgi:hypothetical protein
LLCTRITWGALESLHCLSLTRLLIKPESQGEGPQYLLLDEVHPLGRISFLCSIIVEGKVESSGHVATDLVLGRDGRIIKKPQTYREYDLLLRALMCSVSPDCPNHTEHLGALADISDVQVRN